MIKEFNFKLLLKILSLLIILLIPNFNSAKEILIYADSITYDENENIIAKGNAKIFQDNQIIISELIIYNKLQEKIILPTKFSYRDANQNFFEGENGYFLKDLKWIQRSFYQSSHHF